MILRSALIGAISVLTLSLHAMAEPTPAATSAFNAYIDKVEAGLAKQHSAADNFLATSLTTQEESLLRQGQLVIGPLTPVTGSPLPGALLHDWRGTAFVLARRSRILSGC